MQGRRLALESIIGDAINKERRRELELNKLHAGDADFKKALNQSFIRILALQQLNKSAEARMPIHSKTTSLTVGI